LLIFVENEYDFMKLNKAAQDGRYAVTVFEPVFLRRPETSHVVSSIADQKRKPIDKQTDKLTNKREDF
jgi:hypothetical protein